MSERAGRTTMPARRMGASRTGQSRRKPGTPSPYVAASSSPLFVNAVEKAMNVLVAFDGTRRHLSLSQIAEITGLDVSAAQRFTFTLTRLGYLRKDERTRKYALSPRLLEFTSHYLESSDLVSRAAPYLAQLAQATEEVANLSVLDGADVVFVHRIVTRHVLLPTFLVGSRLPAYATAPGLAMLATLEEAEVRALLAASPPVAHTRNTMTDPGAILARLADIRAKGYAHTREEYFLGDISIAVAIPSGRGAAAGAINIAVAKARWQGAADERRFAAILLEAAAAIGVVPGDDG
jgi:IclR family transcriptional regulator, pca regulon regulatory protein